MNEAVVILNGAARWYLDLVGGLADLIDRTYLVRVSTFKDGERKAEPTLEWLTAPPAPDDSQLRNFLIVDDIADSGATVSAVEADLRIRLAGQDISTFIAVLLERVGCHAWLDWVGFRLQRDQYVYGYGLDDADGSLRELPLIAYTPEGNNATSAQGTTATPADTPANESAPA